jgi:hypothetical protein
LRGQRAPCSVRTQETGGHPIPSKDLPERDSVQGVPSSVQPGVLGAHTFAIERASEAADPEIPIEMLSRSRRILRPVFRILR